MGSRSKTLLRAPDGAAVYYATGYGSPEYHVPRLGAWLLACAQQGRPPSLAAWEEWGAGTEYAPETTVSRRPADTSPLRCEHVYTLTITGAGHVLLCYQHHPWWNTDRLTTGLECDSAAELLTAGIEYAARLRRQTEANRRWIEINRDRPGRVRDRHGDPAPSVAAAEEHLTRAIGNAAAYAETTAPTPAGAPVRRERPWRA